MAPLHPVAPVWPWDFFILYSTEEIRLLTNCNYNSKKMIKAGEGEKRKIFLRLDIPSLFLP